MKRFLRNLLIGLSAWLPGSRRPLTSLNLARREETDPRYATTGECLDWEWLREQLAPKVLTPEDRIMVERSWAQHLLDAIDRDKPFLEQRRREYHEELKQPIVVYMNGDPVEMPKGAALRLVRSGRANLAA